jgi:hypothetical protein
MLRNPAYAGVYAYGRSTLDPKRRRAGRPFTGRVRVARGNWIVFLPELLPSYISVGQYERGPYPRFLDTGWDYAAAGSVAAVPVS